MLAALEAERGAILQAATAKVGDKVHRAQRVILALPGVMAQYAKQIQAGPKALNDPKEVTVAREAVKKLLAEPAIVLKPTDDGTGLEGNVRFRS